MKANGPVLRNAHNKESARVVLKRTIDALGVEANETKTEPYDKGGFLVSVGTALAR